MEFSKKILYVLWISTALIVLLAFLLMWKFGDLAPLGYIIGGQYPVLATAISFYYWKAKNENMVKFKDYKMNFEEDFNDELDN